MGDEKIHAVSVACILLFTWRWTPHGNNIYHLVKERDMWCCYICMGSTDLQLFTNMPLECIILKLKTIMRSSLKLDFKHHYLSNFFCNTLKKTILPNMLFFRNNNFGCLNTENCCLNSQIKESLSQPWFVDMQKGLLVRCVWVLTKNENYFIIQFIFAIIYESHCTF